MIGLVIDTADLGVRAVPPTHFGMKRQSIVSAGNGNALVLNRPLGRFQRKVWGGIDVAIDSHDFFGVSLHEDQSAVQSAEKKREERLGFEKCA